MSLMEMRKAFVLPPEDGSTTYLYAPKAPTIAADAEGRRQFNLLTAGSVSFLQLTAAWGLTGGEVDSLRHELSGRLGRPEAGIDLQPMLESVDGVSLLLADGNGGFKVLQSGKSSGIPPYHTVFNVMLDAGQLKTVQQALGGKEHLLVLHYDVTRGTPVTTGSAEHVATSEADEGQDGGQNGGGSWSAASASAQVSASVQTTMSFEKLGVDLDAADWPSSR